MIHLPKQLELWSVDRLKPYEKNARTHSAEQVSQIAASIKEFGFTNPILVDSDQGIIAGHGRLMAAKSLGLPEVPVIVLDNLSDAQRRAYILADNKLALNAGWDEKMLAEELERLKVDGFDLDLVGFSPEELEELLDIDPEVAPHGDADEVPEFRAEPKVVRGEVYILGRHRLMCGDSTAITDVERLMNGEKVDMVFTDPPYGIDLDTDYSDMAPKSQTHRKIANDDKPFDPSVILNLDIDETFIWGANYFAKHLPDGGSWIVWDKYPTDQNDKRYGSAFELVWSKTKHKQSICRVGSLNVGHHKREDIVHPTQKPSDLVMWFFERWGKINDRVLDLFGGSGSTLIACEKTNRNCFMMELDPLYCGVILDRWQKFTGKKAHREDGVLWDEIKGM